MQKDNTFSVKNANESSGFLFWRVYSLWQQEIKRVLSDKYGIIHSQYVLLASTHFLTLNGNEVTQVLLSQFTKIDVMNVSQVLKKLEQMGLVARKEHSADTRAKAVFLTDKGRELTKKAVIDIEDIDVKFFSKLGKELENFNDCMLKLINSFQT
ncbi:MAG: winged helix DNA-binding protein [Campylobacteraceae bacterium]|jgi:DNA-binding MarR family transcriptional regulator|nr:winged helix DNA-binding protein [Campylobacteraceae bacterium]